MGFLGGKTQRFHSLYVPVANKIDYCRYTVRRGGNWIALISAALFIYSVVGLVLDALSLVSGSAWSVVSYFVSLLLSGIIKVLDLAAHYEDRFTVEVTEPGYYENIAPPDKSWDKLELHMAGGKTEQVFRCKKIDVLLRGDTPLDICRDRGYEKRLSKSIRSKENWEGCYSKFLRHNHRKAMYGGKQFYNEVKYGLCSEPDPAHPDRPVRVHKTCYFDSYLTNIIPGQKLTRNRDGAELADATIPEWRPYKTDDSGRRVLRRIDSEFLMANEPGVTTLCIKENDTILLWRQNNLAQCSTGQLVASGSGSANWDDCKNFLNDPEKNGLRKAVIRGMERELWEESVGKRGISEEEFCKHLQTRITGYFRWLTKGGKSEFVGVSRLLDSNSMTENLQPEESEVLRGKEIPAGTMFILRNELARRLSGALGGAGYAAGDNGYSVSCAMAMLALQEVCEEYCANCPHRSADNCGGESCPCRPFDVLFEGYVKD